MALIQFPSTDDMQIGGSLVVAGNLYGPSGFLTDDMVSTTAAIQASKLYSQRNICGELFESATACAALTRNIYAAKGAGTILSWKAWIAVVADDVSRTCNVDLKKSTAGGAFATVLSATIAITTSTTVRTLVSGTVSSPSYIAGDLFQAVVTVAGSGGTVNAKGLAFQMLANEAY